MVVPQSVKRRRQQVRSSKTARDFYHYERNLVIGKDRTQTVSRMS